MSYEQNTDKENIATQLITMVSRYELFHDPFNKTYISLEQNGHIENWPLEGRKIKRWLAQQFHKENQTTAAKSALGDAISTLSGKAEFEGAKHTVYNRVAKLKGNYYLDLCDQNWNCIQLNTEGWTVIPKAPVKFVRSASSHAIPMPKGRGDITAIWDFLNVTNKGEQLLLITWMVDCLRPETDYPLLILEGEQGSAKSTTQKHIKALLDPSSMDLRAGLKKPQDLIIATQSDYLVSYNNLSYLKPELQDLFCCLSTGGSIGMRELYTNIDEIMIDIQRPVVMNGISELISAQDLSERCLHLRLPSISESKRQSGNELSERFNKAYPYLVGSLLDLFVKTLNELQGVVTKENPRMADFSKLGIAVTRALGLKDQEFLTAYADNQALGIRKGLESSPVAIALEAFLEDGLTIYTGNLKGLLEKLNPYRPDESAGWPKSPKGLKSALQRQQTAFRKIGILIEFEHQRQANGYQVQVKTM